MSATKSVLTQEEIQRLQIANVSVYVFAMIYGKIQDKFNKLTQKEVVQKWDVKLTPAGWAFAIWGLIYTMIGVFVVYQALPDSYVPTRNNELIFGQIGWNFAVNKISGPIWLMIWGRDGKWAFTGAFIPIVVMLATCLQILFLADRSQVNTMEGIFIRGTFSLYSGWVTTATLLNILYILKSWNTPNYDAR